MPNKIIKTETQEFTISQTENVKEQGWREHLVLVSSLPNRLIGLVENPSAVMQSPFRPFTIYGSLMYTAELAFNPVVEMEPTRNGPQPVKDRDGKPKIVGIQANTRLHCLVPYDLLGTPSIRIANCQYIIRINDQDDGFKNWAFKEYLSFFDPPKIQTV